MKLGAKVAVGSASVMISGFAMPYITDSSQIQFATPILIGLVMAGAIIASEARD